jgi:predicted dinucleotide-binding enzyme
VVKAFNTTFAGTLASGEVSGQQLDVLIASDDEEAKRKVTQLVESGGMRPVDAGPLRRAQQLEHLGFLHMALQDNLRSGYGSAVKFITP